MNVILCLQATRWLQEFDKKCSKNTREYFESVNRIIFLSQEPGTPTWTVVIGAVVAAANSPATAVMEVEEVVGVTNTHLDPAIGLAQNAKPTISPPEQRATGAIPALTRAAGEAAWQAKQETQVRDSLVSVLLRFYMNFFKDELLCLVITDFHNLSTMP